MRRTIITIMGLALSLATADPVIIKKEPNTEWDILIEALIQVESGGNPFAVGRSNDVGALQITP